LEDSYCLVFHISYVCVLGFAHTMSSQLEVLITCSLSVNVFLIFRQNCVVVGLRCNFLPLVWLQLSRQTFAHMLHRAPGFIHSTPEIEENYLESLIIPGTQVLTICGLWEGWLRLSLRSSLCVLGDTAAGWKELCNQSARQVSTWSTSSQFVPPVAASIQV
jgi:hypothetical protein